MGKLILGLVIVIIILIVIVIIRNRKANSVEASNDFVLLSSPSTSTKYLPTVPVNWLEDLEEKYKTQEYNIYDNLYTAICKKLSDSLFNNIEAFKKGEISHGEILNAMTKEQRIFLTVVNFDGQVNNGGVYQFLFNFSHLSEIALESFKIIGIDQLASDYEKVLQEFIKKFDSIQVFYNQFQDTSKKWEERWDAFNKGYVELPSAKIIEKYFYEEQFMQEYQTKIVDFVKKNKSKLLLEE